MRRSARAGVFVHPIGRWCAGAELPRAVDTVHTDGPVDTVRTVTSQEADDMVTGR